MNAEDIRTFREDLKKFNIENLKDTDSMRELSLLFILIGDIFSMVRLPRKTKLELYGFDANNKFYRNKDLVKEVLKEGENTEQ